jgi:hypothetical protein
VIARQYGSNDMLVDATALALVSGRPHSTIRKRCTPVACDARTKRPLYSATEGQHRMDTTPTRNRAPRSAASPVAA